MVPDRPALGAHVRARRHLVDGRAFVMLHVEGASPMQVGDREWTVLRQADGTRDLEGIRLAAIRAGAAVSGEHVRAFFAQLTELGLFAASEARSDAPRFARDLPIVHLPGYAFRCDGSGGCCRQYDTVLFTPLEQARARARLPLLEDAGQRPERAFLPESGATSPLSVITRDGGDCLYLGPDRRCLIHDSKPTGCRTFPARFVDVGDAIRVVPRTECGCVFEPAEGGAPLTTATRGAELPREVFVSRLPEATTMGASRLTPAELVSYFDARASELASEPDPAAYAWALADDIEGRPRDPRQSLAGVEASLARLAPHVVWRAEHDLVRLGVEWVGEALAGATRGPPVEPDDERLYLRAAFFATLGAARSVEHALREHALAIWIARAFTDEAREQARHPLAIVEALARAHGLDLATG